MAYLDEADFQEPGLVSRLTMATAKEPEAKPGPNKNGSSSAAGRHPALDVMLVHRDARLQKLTESILHEACSAIHLRCFAENREAWASIAIRRPDLVILEDSLPWLQGKEMAERLHRLEFKLPIIVTSFWGQSREWVRAQVCAGQKIQILMLPKQLSDLWETICGV